MIKLTSLETLQDWARNHSGDTEIEAAVKSGEDPGLALVKRSYNYIHKYGYKSKLMAAAVRNKQGLFSLLGYKTQTDHQQILIPF